MDLIVEQRKLERLLLQLTPKQKTFAEVLVATDFDKATAAKQAGYKTSTEALKSDRVKEYVELAVRIAAEVRVRRWRDQAMTKEEAVALLSRDARAELIDFCDEDMDIAFSSETPNIGALQEYKVEEVGEMTVKRTIKLPNRQGTIGQLSKVLGWEYEVNENPTTVARDIRETLREMEAMEEDEDYDA